MEEYLKTAAPSSDDDFEDDEEEESEGKTRKMKFSNF